jgi:predicted nucleic acid-binding protein
VEVTLVDTSAWIEFTRATGSSTDLQLGQLISADAPLATTEPVAMELLAGARDDSARRQVRKLIARFEHIAFDSSVDFHEAARIFRECSASGFTPRSHVDCMIAAVALRNDVPLIANDIDFERIRAAAGLRLS